MSEAADLELAERVRSACVAVARSGYEDAAMAGLCAEGALEAALSAVERLDLAGLLASLEGEAAQ